MIIQHFWYTHTRMVHTYRGEVRTYTHGSQLVTVRGDLVQVEIGDAQGVCVWNQTLARQLSAHYFDYTLLALLPLT